VGRICRETGIRVFGPNTLGLINTATGLVTAVFSDEINSRLSKVIALPSKYRIPFFLYPELAIKVFSLMNRYASWRGRLSDSV
jgi:acyl-CoA synthetase (NDP forming)